jgi:mannose-6-phosphate isomerase-like protein (cupin superfamily)
VIDLLVKKEKTFKIITENPRGGKGLIEGFRYLDEEDLSNSLKGFYINDLQVGAEVGYHEHIGDEEIYLILAGKGVANDNGEEKEVAEGDLLYTRDGQGHSLKNTGETPLKFAAFIIEK